MGTLVPALAEPSSRGAAVYEHCLSCHGAQGQGGEQGKYPRIGGLPAGYIENQLRGFQKRQRVNKPMIPVFENGGLDDGALGEVSRYIAQLHPGTIEQPPYRPSPDALAELESEDEFYELAEELFHRDCSQCHGAAGEGKEGTDNPPLANQYLPYLEKQIEDFIAGRRAHENSEKLFAELYPEELQAILFRISTLRTESR
jgi:cytochrome c553